MKLTPIKAIRTKCIECTGNQISEVRKCHITGCALWPYRMGHRPKDTVKKLELSYDFKEREA